MDVPNNADEEEPNAKRIRLATLDLKITVGSDDSSARSAIGGKVPDIQVDTEIANNSNDTYDNKDILGGEEGANTKVYWYHSIIMANHSKYVDAMLSLMSMRENSTRELSFPDITPAVWESMMKFIEDPAAARKMSIGDVLVVAEFYDKYDFQTGRNLCDEVLFDFFQRFQARGDIDVFVDAVMVADRYNLPKSKNRGLKCLAAKLKSTRSPTGFNEHHIAKLVPSMLLLKENELLEEQYSNYDIESPLFPKLFVLHETAYESKKILNLAVVGIEAILKKENNMGTYKAYYKRVVMNNDDAVTRQQESAILFQSTVERSCYMKLKKDAWHIIQRVRVTTDQQQHDRIQRFKEKTLYVAPCSGNSPLPPQDIRWMRVDKNQPPGILTIKYKYRKNEEEQQQQQQQQDLSVQWSTRSSWGGSPWGRRNSDGNAWGGGGGGGGDQQQQVFQWGGQIRGIN